MKFFLVLLLFLPCLLHSQNKLTISNKIVVDFEREGNEVETYYYHSIQDNDKIVFAEIYGDSGAAVKRFTSGGLPDASFGNAGMLIFEKKNCLDTIVAYSGIATDNSSNYFLAGSKGNRIIVTKINSSGKIDNAFGNQGTVYLNPPDDPIVLDGVKIKSDKNGNLIVLANYFIPSANLGVNIYRISSKGKIDQTFNPSPKIQEKITTINTGTASFSIDENNNIIVAGSYNTSGNYYVGYAVKILPSGNYDTGFGTNGIASYTNDNVKMQPEVITTDSVNNIYTGGYSRDKYGDYHGYIAKLSPAGKMDLTFGSQGIVTVNDASYVQDIDIYKNRIYTTAHTENTGTGYHLDITAYSGIGIPDQTFGVKGIFAGNSIGDASEQDSHILSNGNLISLGNPSSNYDVTLNAVTKKGVYDSAYGINGMVLTHNYYSGNDEVFCMTRDNAGNIFAAGATFSGYYSDYGVVKILANGQQDASFGKNGNVTINIDDTLNISDKVIDLTVVNNQHILLAGVTSEYSGIDNFYSMATIDENGNPYNGFGSRWKIKGKVNDIFTANDAIIKNDKVYFAGLRQINLTYHSDATMVKLYTNGKPDSSFNKTGDKIFISYDSQVFHSIVIDKDENVYAAFTQIIDSNARIYKLRSDGVVDSTFANKGLFKIKIGLNNQPSLLRLTASQDILLLNNYQNIGGKPTNFSLTKMSKKGSVDSTFGNDGQCQINTGDEYTKINDVAILTDASILVAAQTICGTEIIRLNADGTIDHSFGENGRQALDELFINKILVYADDTIMLGGKYGTNFLVVKAGFVPNTTIVTEALEQQKQQKNIFYNDENKIISNRSGDVTVVDLMGRIVKNKSWMTKGDAIFLNDGIYVLLFENGNERITQKVELIGR